MSRIQITSNLTLVLLEDQPFVFVSHSVVAAAGQTTSPLSVEPCASVALPPLLAAEARLKR